MSGDETVHSYESGADTDGMYRRLGLRVPVDLYDIPNSDDEVYYPPYPLDIPPRISAEEGYSDTERTRYLDVHLKQIEDIRRKQAEDNRKFREDTLRKQAEDNRKFREFSYKWHVLETRDTPPQKYYLNLENGKTQWTMPDNLTEKRREKRLWVKIPGQLPGQPAMYYNTNTQKSIWQKPVGYVEPSSRASASSKSSDSESVKPVKKRSRKTTSKELGNWIILIDKTNSKYPNRPYYYNKETKVTTWNKPAELNGGKRKTVRGLRRRPTF